MKFSSNRVTVADTFSKKFKFRDTRKKMIRTTLTQTKILQLIMAKTMLKIFLSLLLLEHSAGFSTTKWASMQRVKPLFGIPFIGRFRKKKAVEIPTRITVGSKIPDGDVEVLISNNEGKVLTIPTTISEVLGNGTSILIGMPGAFTPICTSDHLPGYIVAAPKLRDLGVEKIAVITTNDKFVNEEWARKVGLIRNDPEGGEELDHAVTLISDGDGDGDFVKSLGLAEDMGFGVGVRSNRFALIAEAGTVTHLAMDEGMEDCSFTSAASLVTFLTPPNSAASESEFELGENSMKIIGAGLALVIAYSAFSSLLGGSSNPSTPVETLNSAVLVKPAPTKKAPTQLSPSQGSFSLLRDYL